MGYRLVCMATTVAAAVLVASVRAEGQTRPAGPTTASQGATRQKPLAQRIADRDFPSVFQAWNPAEGLGEDRHATMARHDLVFHVPTAFGLRWDRQPAGLATGFRPDSLAVARQTRAQLLRLNPNIILLAAITYRDALPDYLPPEHEWWKRDKDGQRIVGWEEGGALLLDQAREDYQRHVAGQCKAAVDTGVFDGIMLDWWIDDDDRLALIRTIREAIGPEPFVLVNSNDRIAPKTARYVNGFFMECYRSKTVQDWRRIENTLVWAEKNLRPPRINCLEVWYSESRQSAKDLSRMRATTTLALTRSDGCCLYSDPNDLPKPDHLHDWYPFWDALLGKPVAPGRQRADGAWQREFTHGTAVYNPIYGQEITVRFDEPRTSVTTGRLAKEHALAALDGDIYVKSDGGGE